MSMRIQKQNPYTPAPPAPLHSEAAGNNVTSAAKISFLTTQQPAHSIPAAVLESLMADFCINRPGSRIEIKYITQANVDQRLQLMTAQKSLPEMFDSPNSPAGQIQMGRQGQALDLEISLAELGVLDRLTPAAVSIMKQQQGGHLYALPFEPSMEGFWYNKEIFRRRGIDPPSTWDDLVDVAIAFNTDGIQPFTVAGFLGWPITRLIGNYLFRALGPEAMKRVADGDARLTDPQYIKAAQAVADLGASGCFGDAVATLDYTPAEDVFLQGRAAMFYMGSWVIGNLNDPSKNRVGTDNIGYFPFPLVTGGIGNVHQTPMNAGLPTMISAEKYTPAVGSWLKYVAENYGHRALAMRGAVSGFVVDRALSDLPTTTRLVVDWIAATETPLLWFEALFSPNATAASQQNAARLATGSMSASDFMSTVQRALDRT